MTREANSRRETSAFGAATGGVGLFRPDLAERRTTLPSRSENVSHPVFAVVEDGSVWAFRRGGVVVL